MGGGGVEDRGLKNGLKTQGCAKEGGGRKWHGIVLLRFHISPTKRPRPMGPKEPRAWQFIFQRSFREEWPESRPNAKGAPHYIAVAPLAQTTHSPVKTTYHIISKDIHLLARHYYTYVVFFLGGGGSEIKFGLSFFKS